MGRTFGVFVVLVALFVDLEAEAFLDLDLDGLDLVLVFDFVVDLRVVFALLVLLFLETERFFVLGILFFSVGFFL